VDGTPVLDGEQGYRRWVEVMTAEFNALRDCDEKGLPQDPAGWVTRSDSRVDAPPQAYPGIGVSG